MLATLQVMSRDIHNAQNLSPFSTSQWQILTDNKMDRMIVEEEEELTLSHVIEGTGKASAAQRST